MARASRKTTHRHNKTFRFTDRTIERLDALVEIMELPSQNATLEQLIKDAAIKAGIEGIGYAPRDEGEELGRGGS